jgi:fatty acid desaturase
VYKERENRTIDMATAILKEPEGLSYNGGALLYVLCGYALGFAGLFHDSWLVNLPATLLLAHAMVIAAYMIHECGHNLVFRKSRHNAALGRAMSWFCGAAYGTYEDMRYKHFRHHVDNDDVVWFEYEKFFEEHPLVLRATRFLEWFYVPAHDLIMHFIMVFTAFIIPERRDQRLRNVAVIVIRGGIFAALLYLFPKVALLYAVAYLLMMHVLRFMDALQHDYPYHPTLFDYVSAPHKGDREWEQEHTFSVPHSLRFERLNWLTLNFGFHNAHHADMNVPWYRLPALHRELCGDDPSRVIPLGSQLRLYHRNRVLRVCNPQPADYPKGAAYLRAAQAGTGPIGGNAASFLTSF